MRIPTIIGPPAMPSLTVMFIPGMAIGMLPKRRPSTMPMKIVNRFGFLSSRAWLPSTLLAFSIERSSPTIVSRSPSCNLSEVDGRRSIPARFTRVILIPNEFLSLSEPSFTPLISGFVTRIFLDTSWLSIAFQSMPFLFQSISSCGPKRFLS